MTKRLIYERTTRRRAIFPLSDPVMIVAEDGSVKSLYPLGLKLAGVRVLVVGAGAVATRRVPALLDAGADLVLVAPAATPALRALAGAGRLTWHERPFRPSDVDGAWLVTVAVDDPVAAGEVSAAARER